MIMFFLQSALLLVLSFFIGFLLGRFIKRILRNWTAPGDREDQVTNVATVKPVTITASAREDNEAAFSAGIKVDNLQIIEGIGPAMESVLKENGVVTWSQLAAKTVPELRSILDKYGKRYQIIDPTTWLEQARLAAAGKVDDLIRLQKMDGVSKVENMLNRDRKSGFGKYSQDDLKIVEGIGPKIEVLLNNSGINTWKILSETEPSTIRGILQAAGRRYRLAVPESWPLQAKFADDGEWSKLRQFQDKLRDIDPALAGRASTEAID